MRREEKSFVVIDFSLRPIWKQNINSWESFNTLVASPAAPYTCPHLHVDTDGASSWLRNVRITTAAAFEHFDSIILSKVSQFSSRSINCAIEENAKRRWHWQSAKKKVFSLFAKRLESRNISSRFFFLSLAHPRLVRNTAQVGVKLSLPLAGKSSRFDWVIAFH